MSITAIPTPACILFNERINENIERMHEHLAALDTPLRPHVKTSKSMPVVEAMLKGQPRGIAVSTLAEAAFFLEQGITDIIYAVSIAPGKLDEILSLSRLGADLKILLDSEESAKLVGEHGARNRIQHKVLIEIDSDRHRAGIHPDSNELISIAKTLEDSKGGRLSGVLTHAGSSYRCRTTGEIAHVADIERQAVVHASERLKAHDFDCETVSVGSTPTATFAHSLDNVTEVRAGVFVFQDLFQASLGVCRVNNIALAVLTEVIGVERHGQGVFIDAGALALSKDRSTANSPDDFGFGLVSRLGQPPEQGDYVVNEVFQEHGVLIPRSQERTGPKPVLGDRLLVWPNHACMTAAAYPEYVVVDDNLSVTDRWPRVNGWHR